MQNSRKAGGEAGQREFWIRTLSSCARPYGSHSLLSISDSQSVRFPEIPRDSQRFPESQLVGGLSSKVLRV